MLAANRRHFRMAMAPAPLNRSSEIIIDHAMRNPTKITESPHMAVKKRYLVATVVNVDKVTP